MQNDLFDELADLSSDPLTFVSWAFPWGEPGELEYESGPVEWQADVLRRIRDGLVTVNEAIQIAVTSGHGIGKSALVSWIILWACTTFEDCRGVVTANTETQLKTKTWAELAKWYNLFTAKELFEFSATRLTVRTTDTEKQSKWRVDMVPWSERNTEAFAGLHNKGKRVLLLMDEASAIPDMIWETAEGALTDSETEIVWCAFGNPTRNKGRFRECFSGGRFARRWQTRAVDSRTVPFTNKVQIQRWIDDYGEDSDFVRVRVRGVFPRIDAESFISWQDAVEATQRTVLPCGDPIILGVDVGRFGDDPSVIYPRRGLDAVTHPVEVLFGADTMEVAARVAAAFLRLKATIVFADEGGVGGGVVDRLRQLQIPVMGVDFGSKPDNWNVNDGTKYANKRAEVWGSMRLWLQRGGCVPERVQSLEMTVVDELTAPTYGMNSQEAILLEAKKDMRRRGVKSPNVADALACTFAYPVFIPSRRDEEHENAHITPDYNPYSSEMEMA